MAGMVFLKSLSDIAFLFMLMGPVAVHFGAGLMTCVLTCLFILASEVISFLISQKRDNLRLIAYVIPLVSIFLPGKSISWAVVCGMIFAYEVFTGASRRYVPDNDSQKTIFKITAGLTVLMLIILLMAKAVEVSYTIAIFSALISMCCSVLIQRSLRHEPEVYTGAPFQAANIGIVALVCAAAAVLGSRPVVHGILTVLKAIYTAIASAVLFVVTYILRGISFVVRWIVQLFGGESEAPVEQETVTLNPQSANDLFGDVGEPTGFPLWLKIVGIVIAAAIVILIIILVFRKLAGRRVSDPEIGSAERTSYKTAGAQKRSHRDTASVQGVRKYYRKFLKKLAADGFRIDDDFTSGDIYDKAPEKYRNEAAAELRALYIEARYKGTADKAAADRARELVSRM